MGRLRGYRLGVPDLRGKQAVGLDKEYEPGGAFCRERSREQYRYLDSRPKTEQILGERCPVCGAVPMAWCDRSGDRGYLSPASLSTVTS